MVQLPSADSLNRSIPVSRQGVSRVDTAAFAAPGAALERAGQTGLRLANQMADRQDSLQYAEAKTQFLKSQMEVEDAFRQDRDYGTFETRYQEAMSKARENASSVLGNSRLKERFALETELDVARGTGRVKDLAWTKEVDHGVSRLNGLMDENRSAALSAGDPVIREGLISSTQEAIDGALARGYIDETQAVSLRRKWTESYAEGSLDLLTPGARLQALRNVKEGTPLSFIQPDKRAKLIEQAKAEVEREGAIYRARVSDTLQNDLAYLNAGGDPTKVNVNREQLVTAFGAEKGTAYADQLERSVNFASDLRGLAGASPEDIERTLAELKPTDPENFKEGSVRYNTYVAALNARQKALENDPVTYLAQNTPDVAVAIEQASSGDSWDNVVAPLDASYDRLGIPARNRHVLPAQSAKSLVAGIMEQDGANISANLDSLRTSMSASTWNRVYGDLVTLGGLPTGAQVVVEISPANGTAKDAMGQALKLGSKELDNLIVKEDKTAIEDEVPNALAEFRTSLVGSAAGNAAYLERARAVTDLAKTYLANGTVTSATDAVEKAATDVVNWAYDFSDTGWRVPKDASGISRLADVEAVAEQTIQSLAPADLAVMPADAELVRVLGKEEVQRQYAAQPKVWRNTANDEGLQLFYANSGLPVFDAKGDPVLLNFDQVEPGSAPRDDGIIPPNVRDMLPSIPPIFPDMP